MSKKYKYFQKMTIHRQTQKYKATVQKTKTIVQNTYAIVQKNLSECTKTIFQIFNYKHTHTNTQQHIY